MQERSDRELLELSAKDPEAFGVLFERHFDRIFGYIFRRIASWDAARDLTSEVFLKALRSRWKYRWTGAPVSAWLYAIATNEIRMYYRRGRRALLSLDAMMEGAGVAIDDALARHAIEERAEAERTLDAQMDFAKVRTVLAALPLKYQDVIALRFFEDLSVAEIAATLGKNEGTIKSLLSRGIARLRVALEGDLHHE